MASSSVAVCSRSFSQNAFLREALKQRYQSVRFNEEGVSLQGEELVNFCKGYSKIIVALEKIDFDILSKLTPELTVISKFGVGLDNIELESVNNFGVKLGWAPGVNRRSVAELVLCFSILAARHLLQAINLVSSGGWQQIRGRDLGAMTIGVVGYGNVGSEVGKIFKAMGCKVLVHDIVHPSDLALPDDIEFVGFEELLRVADIISIHVPLTKTTRVMFNSDTFNKVQHGAIFINTSRGEVVCEIALLNALRAGRISTACLDVLSQEPPFGNELLEHKNVIVTPHIGGSTEESVIAMGLASIENLEKNFLAP